MADHLVTLRRFFRGRFSVVLIAVMVAGCYPVQQSVVSDPASLTLVNQANGWVHYVFMAPCGSTEWGPDQLRRMEMVRHGTRRTFAVPTGCFDLKARLQDGREVVRQGVQLLAGREYVWTLSS